MASGWPAFLSRSVVVAMLVGAVTALAPQANAAPGTLRDGLARRPENSRFAAPPVARYVSEDGDRFVLDRSGGRPLLKFDNSPEIWALSAQPAPRGDIIYKNDLGEPMLRATRVGGLILFTDSRPAGAAVALAGPSNPLKLPTFGPQALLERLALATAISSRAARHQIRFEVQGSQASAALIADAAVVTAEAIQRMSRRKDGRALLAKVRRVQIGQDVRPSATLDGEVLRIRVAPSQGLAGRPSSDRIMLATLNR